MLIDGHVHLHRSHSIEAALDAAVINFERARSRLSPAGPGHAALWLVETPAESASTRLRAGGRPVGTIPFLRLHVRMQDWRDRWAA